MISSAPHGWQVRFLPGCQCVWQRALHAAPLQYRAPAASTASSTSRLLLSPPAALDPGSIASCRRPGGAASLVQSARASRGHAPLALSAPRVAALKAAPRPDAQVYTSAVSASRRNSPAPPLRSSLRAGVWLCRSTTPRTRQVLALGGCWLLTGALDARVGTPREGSKHDATMAQFQAVGVGRRRAMTAVLADDRRARCESPRCCWLSPPTCWTAVVLDSSRAANVLDVLTAGQTHLMRQEARAGRGRVLEGLCLGLMSSLDVSPMTSIASDFDSSLRGSGL